MKKTLLLMVATVFLHADTMSDAFVAYLQKDYASALAMFKSHEHENKPGVDYMIAKIYLDRNTTEENTSITIRYFEKAKQEGHPDAAGQLAKLYARPGADNASLKKALANYDAIPSQDDRTRSAEAKVLYRLGRYKEALSLYTLLSYRYKKAKYTYKIASMYEHGLGVKADINRAKRLYRTAANRGSKEAVMHLAQLLADECRNGTNPYAGNQAKALLKQAIKKRVFGASKALKALEEDPRCKAPTAGNAIHKNSRYDTTRKPAPTATENR